MSKEADPRVAEFKQEIERAIAAANLLGESFELYKDYRAEYQGEATQVLHHLDVLSKRVGELKKLAGIKAAIQHQLNLVDGFLESLAGGTELRAEDFAPQFDQWHSLIDAIPKLTRESVEGALENLKSGVEKEKGEFCKALKEFIGLLNKFVTLIEKLKEELGELVAVVEERFETIRDKFEELLVSFGDIKEELTSAIDNEADELTGSAEECVEFVGSLGDKLHQVFDSVMTIYSQFQEGMKATQGGIASATEAMTSVEDALSEVFSA